MNINWQELYKEYREENIKTFPLYEGFSKSPKEVFDWFKNKLSEKPINNKNKTQCKQQQVQFIKCWETKDLKEWT